MGTFVCSELGQSTTGCSGECCFRVMYGEWYGVCDVVVLSVVEICGDYGVGVCVNVCGVVCVVVCCLLCCSVLGASGDHMVETYSSRGLVMALYVAMSVSFCFPHVVDVSAWSICIVLRAFVVVISMYLLYVSLGSRVGPSIFGLMFMGSVMLSI